MRFQFWKGLYKSICIGIVLSAVIAGGSFAGIANAQESGITDAEINNFLIHINSSLEAKVKTLSGTPVRDFFIPVLFNVQLSDITDNYGAPRPGGRTHEGEDILAPRGTPIVSPTEAVVTNVGYDQMGGNFVITANPGGEQFYYAHLNAYPRNIAVGEMLVPGDIVGYVGNTGDAAGGPTHLHLGIYFEGTATNPYPRITKELSLSMKLSYLESNLDSGNISYYKALQILDSNTDLLSDPAARENVAIPYNLAQLMNNKDLLQTIKQVNADLSLGDDNSNVAWLQQFLINENSGPVALRLAKTGATGYFGSLTQQALAEYQKVQGISPASGNYGPLTREYMFDALAKENPDMQLLAGSASSSQNSSSSSSNAGGLALAEQPRPSIVLSRVISITRDLTMGSQGNDVSWLQQFLIDAAAGPSASALANAGATGYFGSITRRALAEYQKAEGISPAVGYFGPVTRATING